MAIQVLLVVFDMGVPMIQEQTGTGCSGKESTSLNPLHGNARLESVMTAQTFFL
jgi:hypothetical protein